MELFQTQNEPPTSRIDHQQQLNFHILQPRNRSIPIPMIRPAHTKKEGKDAGRRLVETVHREERKGGSL